MRWWYRAGLILLVLHMSLPMVYAQGDSSTRPTGGAHRAYVEGVIAMADLDYQAAVITCEQAVQGAPTHAVSTRALALARRTLGETRP
jgi:hypothetical protein